MSKKEFSSLNKGEFASFIAGRCDCTKADAEKMINDFVDFVIDAASQGFGVNLVGFGNFTLNHVESRSGRNPRTGEPMQIKAYTQPKFKAGQKLKDACN